MRMSFSFETSLRWRELSIPFALCALTQACAPPTTSFEDESPPTAQAVFAQSSAPTIFASGAIGRVSAATLDNVGVVVWETGSGATAQRFDASGAPLGEPIKLEHYGPVAAGDGVFAVLYRTTYQLYTLRISQDGTLIDPGFTPLLQANTFCPYSVDIPPMPSAAIAHDGQRFRVRFVRQFEAGFTTITGDDIGEVAFDETGPITPSTECGWPSNYSLGIQDLACSNGECVRLSASHCSDPDCVPAAAGLFFVCSGGVAEPPSGGTGVLTASPTRFLAAFAGDGLHAILLNTHSCQASSQQIAPSISDEAGHQEVTDTFDGADFLIVYKLQGALQAQWISPSGDISSLCPETLSEGPAPDVSLKAVSFGDGHSLLFSREGGDIAVRALQKGSPSDDCFPPFSPLPDGTFGAVSEGPIGPPSSYANSDEPAALFDLASRDGQAMIVKHDPRGEVMEVQIDADLHARERSLGELPAGKPSIAASPAGYLTAYSHGTSLEVRRFSVDGAPMESSWLAVPAELREPTMAVVAARDEEYNLFFIARMKDEYEDWILPTVAKLGVPLSGMPGIFSLSRQGGADEHSCLTGAACNQTACIVTLVEGNQLFIDGPDAFASSQNLPSFGRLDTATLARTPTQGLLVVRGEPIEGFSTSIFAQLLDATGNAVGEPWDLGPGVGSYGSDLAVAWDGERFVVAWTVGGHSTCDKNGIAVNWVAESGPVYPVGQVIVTGSEPVSGPLLAPAKNGETFLAYVERTSTGLEGKIRKIAMEPPCKDDAACGSDRCVSGRCCPSDCEINEECAVGSCMPDGVTCITLQRATGTPCKDGICIDGTCAPDPDAPGSDWSPSQPRDCEDPPNSGCSMTPGDVPINLRGRVLLVIVLILTWIKRRAAHH